MMPTGWDEAGLALGVAVGALVAYGLARSPSQDRARRAAWFAVGWSLLVVALWSPLHDLGHHSFALHMVQHLVLIAMAPPMLLRAHVGGALRAALPVPTARRLGRSVAGPAARLRRVAHRPSGAALIVFAHVAVLWGVHAPVAYNAGLRSPMLHFAEHAALLATATAVWWGVMAGPAARRASSVLGLAVSGAAGGGLATLIVVGPVPWSPLHDPAAAGLPLTLHEDQQLGGGLMMLVGGLVWTGAAVGAFIRWLQAVERRQIARERRAGAHGHVRVGSLAAWATCLAALGLLLAGCDAGSEPADATVSERGEEALVEYGCLSCHAVEGLPGPQGGVGPPLDGIGDRRTIAGQLPNTTENLAAWIRNPQEIDPGNLMPDVGVTEEDARALAEYLQQLD